MDQELVCYCFGYTELDIKNDFTENGHSTIIDRIISEKKNGNCKCDSTNPKRRLCLNDIRQVVSSITGITELDIF